MNSSHADNEKGLTRWEGGADFGNALIKARNVSSHKMIISREERVEAEIHFGEFQSTCFHFSSLTNLH